ncbi:MAG: insulinase family protein [Nitrospirae bacterium]|nr:insulinase family protein [Nitrospirota bacterium]
MKKGFLDNGIPVVMERMTGVRSVSMGIWVKVGARYERLEKNGISHFVEHMLFKGTKNRTQKDIAIEIDSMGGDINAFTSRENTTFYVKLLKDFTSQGIDILSDIYLNSLLMEEDIKKEQEIIGEEIKMVEDTPDEYIHDLFYEDIWGKDGLGMNILGTQDSVNLLTRGDLVRHMDNHYGTNDIVISAAGNVDYEAILKSFNEKLGFQKTSSKETVIIKEEPPTQFKGSVRVHKKDLSEVHLCIGVRGVKQDSMLRYPFLLLNTIVGSGVSSRLFQEIRENRGLAYTIYSFLSSYHDTGVFGVFAATGKKKYVEVIETILNEIKSLKDTLTEKELQRAKSQLKGNILLNMESSSGRMQNIARQEIYYGRHYPPQAIIRGIDKVKLAHIHDIIDGFLHPAQKVITVLGPASLSALKGIC